MQGILVHSLYKIRIPTALICFALVNLGQLLLSSLGVHGFWLFHICMALSFFCFSFIGANFNALAMEPLGHVAGTASMDKIPIIC